jgi:hypothetical protein
MMMRRGVICKASKNEFKKTGVRFEGRVVLNCAVMLQLHQNQMIGMGPKL